MYFNIFTFCFFNLLIFVKVNPKNYNDIYECSKMHDYIVRILGKMKDVANGRERLLNLSRSLNENCLLSHLLSYAAVNHELVDKWNMTTTKDLLTMADIPPNDLVNVLIYEIRLKALEIMENEQRLIVGGDCRFSWKDDRLKWNKEKISILTTTKPLDRKHIWMPDVVGDLSYQETSVESDYHPDITYKGFVNMGATFIMPTFCNYDLTKFPFDVHNCCIEFQSQKYGERVTFKNNQILSLSGIYGDDIVKFNEAITTIQWKVLGADIGFYTENEYGNHRVARICIKIGRSSKSLIAGTVLPVAASMIVTVLMLLMSTWKQLMYGKCFCLIIQLLCLFSFMQMWGKPISTGLPMIIKFYQFIIWTTVISMFITMILWSLSIRAYKLPPPHMLVLLATFINRWFFFNNREKEPDHTATANGSEDPTDVSRKDNWQFIFVMINNIFVVIFLFTYVVGTFAILSY